MMYNRIEKPYYFKTFIILKINENNFKKCCLAMDPNKRWSCTQLLEHPYFDNYIIETKKEETKSRAYQQMFQHERKSKPQGVNIIYNVIRPI